VPQPKHWCIFANGIFKIDIYMISWQVFMHCWCLNLYYLHIVCNICFFSLFTVNTFGFVIGELLVCMIFFKNVLFTWPLCGKSFFFFYCECHTSYRWIYFVLTLSCILSFYPFALRFWITKAVLLCQEAFSFCIYWLNIANDVHQIIFIINTVF